MTDKLIEVLITTRFHAGKKSLEQYKAVPVIVIGVTNAGEGKEAALLFSLDNTLSLKDTLKLMETVTEILKEEIQKISITNIKA